MKLPFGNDIPTMVGTKDLAMLKEELARQPDGMTIVELGPWLGAVSVLLAPKGTLHVVDRFDWTKDHAKRVPDLLEPGESFQPVHAAILESRGLEATYHPTSFENLIWNGGEIDFLFIDSPKTGDALIECLEPLGDSLSPGGTIVIKNGLNPKFRDMITVIDQLIDAGALIHRRNGNGYSGNCLVLRVGDRPAAIREVFHAGEHEDFFRTIGLAPATGEEDAPEDVTFRFAKIAGLIEEGRWTAAYEALAEMEPDSRNVEAWEATEPSLASDSVDADDLATFSEIVQAHNETSSLLSGNVDFKGSASLAQRAYWTNNADKPWRAKSFQPRIIERAHDFGYMNWASTIRDHVRGKDVLDVGCGPGLHGLGYIVAGAKSYVGLDPIIKVGQDRAKNLNAGSQKMAFGWTPREIAAKIEPWHVLSTPIERVPDQRLFDIATLHNVTEHLIKIESVFEAIARRLRPGGRILFNHDNYYSWNGHHQPPKRVREFDPSNPDHLLMADWAHIAFDPDPDHYIARGLNRIRLDDLIALTERYFEIEEIEEIASTAEVGGDRLTDEIRQNYPHLTDRDLLTKNLFCIATVRID